MTDRSKPIIQCQEALITRRKLLTTSAVGAACALIPSTAFASTSGSRDPRFLTIILRGALDGMAAVPPVGDPQYADLRAGFELAGEAITPLDGFFALNANMPILARLYANKDALIVHAAATPYRERSHFDGQDILETGFMRAGGKTGWLNRATGVLATQNRARPPQAVSLGYTAPLVMRGDVPVMSWAPQAFPQPDDDTVSRILALYDANRPDLADVLRTGIRIDGESVPEMKQGGGANRHFLKEIEQTISFFKDPDGPRIAALGSDGWDTHAAQNPTGGRLANLLRTLDNGIGNLERGLRPIWEDTVITIVTEFGRTAAINGTRGTDHGTATTAFLIGGAVKGGKVVSDWPGLKRNQLHENRDLRPTTSTNSIFKGVLRDHLGIDRRTLAKTVFPESDSVSPLEGLIG